MTPAENIFIVAASIVLLILALWVKKIDWSRLGFTPSSLYKGWWQVLLFNICIFALVQVSIANELIELPDWMIDKDPILPLIALVFLQEIIFRGLLLSWLERWGEQRALWISVIVFVIFHLLAPYTWTSAGLTFATLTVAGGYFWGWHFLKYRNIYLLTLSHLTVNLSFNFVLAIFFAFS